MMRNSMIDQERAEDMFPFVNMIENNNSEKEDERDEEVYESFLLDHWKTDDDFDLDAAEEDMKKLDKERGIVEQDSSEIRDYYERVIRSIPLLSEEEELYWAKLAKDGNEKERKLGKDTLVEHNLRYVLKIAGHFQVNGMTYDDIVQEGAIGLMQAAEKFDYTKGYRFTTYATWWIRQKISRSICDNGRMVRIPVHIHESLHRLRKAEAEVKQLSLTEAEEIKWLCKKTGFTREKLYSLMSYRQDAVSLDTPVSNSREGGSAEDSVMSDFIADEKTSTPEDEAMREMVGQMIHSCMNKCLSDREKDVITRRFGLNGGTPMTLEEVGATMNVTRERVRQIESKALKKMRNPRYDLRCALA